MENITRIDVLEEKVNNLESIICRLIAFDITEDEKIKIIESLILDKTNNKK
jgi:hypothetical protein